MAAAAPAKKTVTFIQYDEPPLKSGEYLISATQTVSQPPPHNQFSAMRRIAVAGERFVIDGSEIVATFPPPLSTGEFSGVLPHVVFAKRTLPWQRTLVHPGESSNAAATAKLPWLAVLSFSGDEWSRVCLHNGTAADLIKHDEPIHIWGSDATGTGTLPDTHLSYPVSYPDIKLDYGEKPTDKCVLLDIPVDLFNQVAPAFNQATPAASDAAYLAHVRETDTSDSEDTATDVLQRAIVMGHRVGLNNADNYAVLVSLENLGPYLPDDQGKASSRIKPDTTTVRLVSFRVWRYFTNRLDQTFTTLLENLNKNPPNQGGVTSLSLPGSATAPAADRVAVAMNHQANGTLGGDDAAVLVANAFAMGYVPLDHHLRPPMDSERKPPHVGKTVSWYRGPLIPCPAPALFLSIPATSADAMTRYDPQTGMFDVSFAAAWQLGQLMALQNNAFATTLYVWKKTLAKGKAIEAEQALLAEKLGGKFATLLQARAARLAAMDSVIPQIVSDWIAKLRLLQGVPFAYIVPDERMLPPESLRFFYYDPNWIEALIDGALSIGRATVDDVQRDKALHARVRPPSIAAAHQMRKNRSRVALAAADADGPVTGFLLRSQAVAGWPRLNVNGYTDPDGRNELTKLRMVRLSKEVLLCLFIGAAPLKMLAIHEAPESLHCGVEGADGIFTTTLREIAGDQPGQQYLTDPVSGHSPNADVPVRADKRSLRMDAAATAIKTKLRDDFKQPVATFTSAEMALELVRGVVRVEFQTP
jgi:hypothetical protein